MTDGREWDIIYADEMDRMESIDYEKLERWAKTEFINNSQIRVISSDSTGSTFERYSNMNTAVDTGAQWTWNSIAQWPRDYIIDKSKADPHNDWGKYNPWRDDHDLISADAMDAIIEAALYWKKVANEEYGQKNLLYPNPAGAEKLDEFLGEFSTEE